MDKNTTYILIVIAIVLLLFFFYNNDSFQSIGQTKNNNYLVKFYNYPGNIANESLLGGYIPPYLQLNIPPWTAPGSQESVKLSYDDFIKVLTNKYQCPLDRPWFQIKDENGLCGYCSHS